MAYTYNPSVQEVEAGTSVIASLSFETSLGYMKHCQKKKGRRKEREKILGKGAASLKHF